MLITSLSNLRVKTLVALRRRRDRDDQHVMLVEGYAEVRLALSSGQRPQELYYCPALMGGREQLKLVARAEALRAEVVELSRDVFEKVAYRESPDGWLAVFPALDTRLERPALGTDTLGPDPLILVVEGIEKPGNLGAILRTAEAAGVAAVIMADSVIDLANPNVVRASKGALFAVPVAGVSTAEAITWLKQRGFRIVAAEPAGSMAYTAARLTGPVALVVGPEQASLSSDWTKAADEFVHIPMVGHSPSLNVAMAAGLLIYEAVRQRTA
mgnify:CR=1 FL=1